MAGEWRTLSLKDAGVTLLDCDHRTPLEAFAGFPYVTIPQMKDGELDFHTARLISPSDFVEWTRKTAPRPFDVVLSRRCNPGDTAHVREGQVFALGQNLVLLRADGRIVAPSYLRWMTKGPAWWSQVEKYRNPGAVFDSLKCRDIIKFELPIPLVSNQSVIADLLGALDDKIELNRRMAETLEAMARALFQSWFVDFDPVRAKAEGRSTGLPDELSALFPNSLDDNGTPKGWQSRPLPTLARFLNGLALQKYPAHDDEPSLPVIKIAELRVGPTSRSGRASKSVPADYHVQDGDHLFSWSGSLTHRRWTYGPGALNQHLFKVSSLGQVPAWLIYHAVDQHMPEFQAIASGKAVTMGDIQRHHLDEAVVACPPSTTLTIMDAIMSPLHDRTLVAALQSRTLADLRDTLLPKLISGELRTADAEERFAAA